MSSTTVSRSLRKRVLRVVFISLVLDLISFTFILPLFPSLLNFYLKQDLDPSSLLNGVFHYLNAYKNSFAKPIDSRYDIVLLGGALGSLFSFLQAIAAPIIGRLSDKYGRRKALLGSMAGNILSVALWVVATDFRTFLASRIVGGLSEGNVQLANAIATDISDGSQRGATMAMVGACFSIAFICGPALGAALSNITTVASNPFAAAAGFSLFLLIVETAYLYFCLPETHPDLIDSKGLGLSKPPSTYDKNHPGKRNIPARSKLSEPLTNHPLLLNLTHLAFLLPFSGMEFSLPFLTATLYTSSAISPSAMNGRLLSIMGLIAAFLQGTVVRRLPPLLNVRVGVVFCVISFFLLARISSIAGLQVAACLLAVTNATVVTGLNSLASYEAGEGERGVVLGRLRGYGQAGRAAGPILFCTLFWWIGRKVAYMIGGATMLGVCIVVFTVLQSPRLRLEKGKENPSQTIAKEENLSTSKYTAISSAVHRGSI